MRIRGFGFYLHKRHKVIKACFLQNFFSSEITEDFRLPKNSEITFEIRPKKKALDINKYLYLWNVCETSEKLKKVFSKFRKYQPTSGWYFVANKILHKVKISPLNLSCWMLQPLHSALGHVLELKIRQHHTSFWNKFSIHGFC